MDLDHLDQGYGRVQYAVLCMQMQCGAGLYEDSLWPGLVCLLVLFSFGIYTVQLLARACYK